jgi:hypothetical protein
MCAPLIQIGSQAAFRSLDAIGQMKAPSHSLVTLENTGKQYISAISEQKEPRAKHNVKKAFRNPRPHPGCHLPNSPYGQV